MLSCAKARTGECIVENNRLNRETKFFENLASFSALPEITNWWSERFLKPRLNHIFQTQSPIEFYAAPISAACRDKTAIAILSLGSGDGENELGIYRRLISNGITNFNIKGFELSGKLVDRANAHANKESFSNIKFEVRDLDTLDLGELKVDPNAVPGE